MKIKKEKIGGYTFYQFADILKQDLENKKFRSGYLAELGRLRLAHDIRTLRQKSNMTQAQVAARVRMPQSVIARIESGNHNLSVATLHKVAGAFDRHIELVEYKKKDYEPGSTPRSSSTRTRSSYPVKRID